MPRYGGTGRQAGSAVSAWGPYLQLIDRRTELDLALGRFDHEPRGGNFEGSYKVSIYIKEWVPDGQGSRKWMHCVGPLYVPIIRWLPAYDRMWVQDSPADLDRSDLQARHAT